MAGPLDRTWFNTLIDDDGSGVGTVWNRAQVDEFIATIDDALEPAVVTADPRLAGYWEPVSNGDPLSPELLFDSHGRVIVGFVPF